MAGEDIILKTLIQAGLNLNPKDYADVQRKLAELGQNVDLGNLKEQAKELSKLFNQVYKDRDLLERAATKGTVPGALSKKDQAELQGAFNRVKTYQAQLTKLGNSLNNLGTSEGKPLFNDLAGLQQILANLGAVAQKIAPLIDNVTQSFQTNAKAARKAEAEAAKNRRDLDAQQRTADTLERARRIKAIQTPEGRQAYLTAARGKADTVTTSANAKQGRAFAASAVTAGEKAVRLQQDRFGPDSPEARAAEQKLARSAQVFNDLDRRATQLAAEEAQAKQAARIQASQALRQENIDRNVRVEAGKNPVGQQAHFAAFRGDTTEIITSEQARAGQAFATKELDASKKIHALTQEIFGKDSDEYRRATRDLEATAAAYSLLTKRVNELAAAEANLKTERTQAEKYQAALLATENQRRNNALKLANGKSALEASNGDFSNITDRQALRRARTFAASELTQLRIQQDAAGKALGVGSEEYRKAQAAADAYAQSVAALEYRLDQLAKTPRAAPSQDNFRSSQVQAEGKAIYESASQVQGGVGNLAGNDAKQAQAYLKARLAEQVALGKQLTKQHGENSTQAKAAGEAARKYAKDLETLNAATKPANSGLNLLQNTLKSFFKYAIGYGVLYALAGAIKSVITEVIDLQAKFLEIQAVTGSTDAEMSRLTQTVFEVAKNSKFALKDLTDAALTLAQAGVSVNDMNTTLKATADFAAATGTNLQVASDLISSTRSVFKELSDDVIANQLAKAVNISKLTGEDLKTIISLGAQTAKSFGLSSAQYLGAVATLRDAGLKASTASTGLRQAMLEIFTPSAKLVKGLQEQYAALGEKMGTEAIKARFNAFSKGNAPLLSALSELKRLGFNDEGSLGLSRAFDVRSGNAIKALISNMQELSSSESKITFGRAAAEGADTTIKGLSASFTRLQSTIGGFVYNRSEGVLGFFTAVVDGADKAIQKLDEYDLHRRAQGKDKNPFVPDLPTASELFLGGVPRQVFKFFKQNTYDRLFPGDQTKEEAGAQADAQGQELTNKQNEFEKYNQAAKTWDVKLAELGKNVGSAAENLVNSSQAADDLKAAFSNVFGKDLPKTTAEIADVVKSYTDLAPSQRDVRLEELKKQFPEMQKLTDKQLDRSLFAIEQLNDTVNGALAGLADQMNTKLVNSRKTLEKMKGAAPSTPEELEAQVFQQIVAQSDDIQQILRGTSTAAFDVQFKVLKAAQQTLADEIRAKGAVNPLDGKAKEVADQFVQRIKAISLSDNKSTAEADMRAAVTELLARFHNLDDAAVDHLQQIQGAIFDAASQLQGGLLQKLLNLSVGQIQQKLDVRANNLVKETSDRVKYNAEKVGPTLANPKFKEYIENGSDATGAGTQQLLADIKAGSVPVEDAQANSKRYQLTAAKVKEYSDIQARHDTLEKEVVKETNKQLGLEEARTKAAEEYDDAKTNKQFGLAKKKLAELTQAEIAIEQQKVNDAKDAMDFDVTADPAKNKRLIKDRVTAEKRIDELKRKQLKEAERIDREAGQVSIQRTGEEAALAQKRAKESLDKATDQTPQSVIDENIAAYDKATAELRAINERKKQHQGELNAESRAAIEEKNKTLVPYKEQAAYLEGVFRREKQARDRIAEMLEVHITTGNRLTDAKLESRGLIAGDRPTREAFLKEHQTGLTTLVDSSQKALDTSRATEKDLAEQVKANPRDQNLAARLAEARKETHELAKETEGWKSQLGAVELELGRVTGTWKSGLNDAFDGDTIKRSLEQSESSLEHFGDTINKQVVGSIEGVGDALADALTKGQSFGVGLNKIFSQLGQDALRTVVKTFTNEMLGNLGTTLLGDKDKGTKGLLGGYLTLGKGKQGDDSQPGLFDSIGSFLFGTPAKPKKAKPAIDPATASASIDDAGSPNGQPVADLAKVAETEGKGFFENIGGQFGSLIDKISGGFGGLFGGLIKMLSAGVAISGGGAGAGMGWLSLISSAAGMLGGGSPAPGGSATYKGAFQFAGGGIVHGPGTGTSDSVPAFVAGPGGTRQPLMLSAGESILTAKATATLGEHFVHAVNSGRMLHAATGAIVAGQASLSSSAKVAAGMSSAAGSADSGSTTYQVNVSPAHMRMRMGDWLDQHVLNERARR